MDLERLDTVDTSETRYFKKLRPSPVSLVSPVLSSFYTLELRDKWQSQCFCWTYKNQMKN